jgi:hypothetical protein
MKEGCSGPTSSCCPPHARRSTKPLLAPTVTSSPLPALITRSPPAWRCSCTAAAPQLPPGAGRAPAALANRCPPVRDGTVLLGSCRAVRRSPKGSCWEATTCPASAHGAGAASTARTSTRKSAAAGKLPPAPAAAAWAKLSGSCTRAVAPGARQLPSHASRAHCEPAAAGRPRYSSRHSRARPAAVQKSYLLRIASSRADSGCREVAGASARANAMGAMQALASQ